MPSSDPSDLVLTGASAITPAGATLAETFEQMLAGFSLHTHSRAHLPMIAGESAASRMTRLAESVARAAMADAGWAALDSRTAIVVGTSKGPADDWLVKSATSPTSDKPSNPKCEDVTSARPIAVTRPVTVARPAMPNNGRCEDVTPAGSVAILPARPKAAASGSPCEDVTPAAVLAMQPVATIDDSFGLAAIAAELAKRLGVTGPVMTTSAACASSMHALIRAAMMLRHGEADRAIVVGVESSLHPAFLESFRRLGVLAPPGDVCRPFDLHRQGFLMSEAAAAICIECRSAGGGEITLAAYGVANDATHLTGTSGNAAALRHCLAQVIADQPIDLIHAHGTGTPTNDAAELQALEATLPPHRPGGARPILFSHKAALGHSLGASGLVAFVLNLQAHRRGSLPGNLNTAVAMTTDRVEVPRQATTRRISSSIAIAAGFGGAIGVVRLRST